MHTSRLIDKRAIEAFLNTDRLYAAYAIGDLEPGLLQQTTWAWAEDGGGMRGLALQFDGLQPPVLFLMGSEGALRAILEREIRPTAAFINCRPEHLSLTRDYYAWERVDPMWRMALQQDQFQALPGEALRLTVDDLDELVALYRLGEGDAFSAAQLQQGIFFGLRNQGRLVAAAGTHLVSPTYGLAAVGNVFTHPDFRGQGHAATLTAAVGAELLRLGMRDVVLNVNQGNAAAIRVYERLGFRRRCAFVEGPAAALTPLP